MSVLSKAVELAMLAPFIATVYKMYLNKPLIVNDRPSVKKALGEIRKIKPEELPIGTHDVAPPGSEQSYVINVYDRGNDDTAGTLQISNPAGFSFIETGMMRGAESTTETLSNGVVQLDSQGDDGYVETIVEPANNGDPNAVKMFGMLVYMPKGKPIFEK